MQEQEQTLLQVEEAGGFALRSHQHAGLVLVGDVNLWRGKKKRFITTQTKKMFSMMLII